jgi:hypothetical protein
MGMSNQESLSFSAEQTRRNLLKMGAIAAPAVAVTLATTKGVVAGQGMNNLGGNDLHRRLPSALVFQSSWSSAAYRSSPSLSRVGVNSKGN